MHTVRKGFMVIHGHSFDGKFEIFIDSYVDIALSELYCMYRDEPSQLLVYCSVCTNVESSQRQSVMCNRLTQVDKYQKYCK